MKMLFLVFALTIATVSTGFADQEEQIQEESYITCLAYRPTLELSGAQSYTGILTEIIYWSLTYSGDKYELSSKEEIQAMFAEQLAGNQAVLLDEALAIRDTYYRRLAKYDIINTSLMTSLKIKDVRYTQDATIEGAEYEVTFGVTSIVETPEYSENYIQTNYEITVGLVYVFDTCSGEGYVPGPTGVKAVKDDAGNVVMNVKVIK